MGRLEKNRAYVVISRQLGLEPPLKRVTRLVYMMCQNKNLPRYAETEL